VDDVRVVDGGEGLGFSLKPFQAILAGGQLLGQHLQRHQALEGRVLGPVHLAHPTRSELVEDSVVSQGLTDHGAPNYGAILLDLPPLLVPLPMLEQPAPAGREEQLFGAQPVVSATLPRQVMDLGSSMRSRVG